jgi:hypothetical protein
MAFILLLILRPELRYISGLARSWILMARQPRLTDIEGM